MDKLLMRVAFVLTAGAVLLVLGANSAEQTASVSPNPMKANPEQYARIQNQSMLVQVP
ncbi:hypothetical protein O9H85_13740 [Paenibacillus filicis]|uniref:Phosphatase n=1 Tax=Paenibacillus gyeongsangnamensis TaxID=3388067 RepID=A0ABT4Q9B9_9BACL|nr:hypothetical protein [Paenibacillus filicis]MCZ8513474.1 hypothetical protein [Paenibacillus filicis]